MFEPANIIDIEVDTMKDQEEILKVKGENDLIKEMNLGQATEKEKKSLLYLIKEEIEAFSRYPEDVGNFRGFTKPYKLPLKPGYEIQWQKQYVLPLRKQISVTK